MEFDIKDLKELVKKEVANLKKFATVKERRRLSFLNLGAESTERCIYGQMTGSCFSERANQLIVKCCEEVLEVTKYQWNLCDTVTKTCKPTLDNTCTGRTLLSGYNTWYSPIEIFISYNEFGGGSPSDSLKLIEYLRNKRKTLDFLN